NFKLQNWISAAMAVQKKGSERNIYSTTEHTRSGRIPQVVERPTLVFPQATAKKRRGETAGRSHQFAGPHTEPHPNMFSLCSTLHGVVFAIFDSGAAEPRSTAP